jgi:murein DD-endopeptidase MepM/ murein hydrolase activator NlpD
MDLREIRFFKSKLVGASILGGILVLGFVLVVNFLGQDFLGIGYNHLSMLAGENRVLKAQVRELARQMSSLQGTLDNIAERGNELRLVADLRTIDDDTRKAAIGGTHRPASAGFLTGEASLILNEAQSLIEKLSRETKLQQASYEEIRKKLEFNRELFAAMPAIKPMAGPYSPNGFGMRLHPVLHVYRMHPGLDIPNDVGTAVYASGDGVVRYAGHTAGGYGIVVEVNHGFGYTTLYAHLSQVLVRPGQRVRRGELIAKCGRSGLVSGPHLHYEVRRNGTAQNPVDYFFDDVDAARYRTMLAAAR